MSKNKISQTWWMSYFFTAMPTSIVSQCSLCDLFPVLTVHNILVIGGEPKSAGPSIGRICFTCFHRNLTKRKLFFVYLVMVGCQGFSWDKFPVIFESVLFQNGLKWLKIGSNCYYKMMQNCHFYLSKTENDSNWWVRWVILEFSWLNNKFWIINPLLWLW